MKKPPFKLASTGLSSYAQAQAVVDNGESLNSLYWEAGKQTYILHFRNPKLLEKKIRELNSNGIYVYRFTYHADEIRSFIASKKAT